jgi:hypothetical protein
MLSDSHIVMDVQRAEMLCGSLTASGSCSRNDVSEPTNGGLQQPSRWGARGIYGDRTEALRRRRGLGPAGVANPDRAQSYVALAGQDAPHSLRAIDTSQAVRCDPPYYS